MNELIGRLVAPQGQIAIVVARFNELITQNLLSGAVDALKRFGMQTSQITTVWAPGAYEIPLIAQQLATSKKYEAVICLGAVIRGATAHFDYVAGPAASNIAQVSLATQIPIIFGVITTETLEQALERAGSKVGNKGYEAAVAAVEMIDIMKQIHSTSKK